MDKKWRVFTREGAFIRINTVGRPSNIHASMLFSSKSEKMRSVSLVLRFEIQLYYGWSCCCTTLPWAGVRNDNISHYTNCKTSFIGVYCFHYVHDLVILSFRQHPRFLLYNINSFFRFLNLHHTLTIRHCMCDRKVGAEGSVLQELCLFVILAIRCLYYADRTYFVK